MLQAINDKVIVEIISEKDLEAEKLKEIEKRTGFLMPGSDKVDPKKAYSAPVLGIVVSMGPEAVDKFGDNIIVGDKVVYNEPKPQGFKHDGKKLLGLTMDQIIARLERDK